MHSSEAPALFRRYPALAKELPHVSLGRFPTPVEHTARLGERIGVPNLWIKRDDLSAEPYGGGKPRKLEFLLGEARALGRTTVVTWGGAGSNHAVATSAYAKKLGMKSIVLLLPQAPTREVRTTLLANLALGADMRAVGTQAEAAKIASALSQEPPRGEGAYVIEGGGSAPLGNAGFVSAALELDEQIDRGELPEPDFVYVAMGTMGSAVGLAIGLRAAGRATRVVAVRASNLSTSSEPALRALFAETVEYLVARDASFPRVRFDEANLVVVSDQLGSGYAKATRRGAQAMELATTGDLRLEPVYTAKAFAALVADAPRLGGSAVIFWHTHSAHSIDVTGVDPTALPSALRAYFASPPRPLSLGRTKKTAPSFRPRPLSSG